MKKTKHELIQEAAEGDLLTFIRLVAPHRVLGKVHEELCRWWTRDDAMSHQLVLLPRDHQKSAMVAYRVAWEITKNPAVTILYISSTSNLAEKQLKAVKDILTSKIYSRYWPTMIHPEEGKREKWTNTEICVDHPTRKLEGVRDSTVYIAGLTTSITGLHCNIAVLDDVVVQENAYIEEGRTKVKSQYSLLASIESTDAREWVVGTRYHPSDLYSELVDMKAEIYDEEGELVSENPVYEVFQREVEDRGDGTGDYLWPRQQRGDGKWFGFSQQILAKKKAQYLDRTQFYAQYYNNPNSAAEEAIEGQYFQYYDKKYLDKVDGKWYYKDTLLSVYAAIDFAFSTAIRADYTSIAVVGIDANENIYVLDADRFKTNRISEYWEHIFTKWKQWEFRKMRAEVTAAQEAIVEDLKISYVRREGIPLTIEAFRPTRNMGTKEERIATTLKGRYESGLIWHYHGGIMEDLELELRQAKPRHDDLKNALADAVAIAKPPLRSWRNNQPSRDRKVIYHTRFGGVA